jgi:hypothetical protein
MLVHCNSLHCNGSGRAVIVIRRSLCFCVRIYHLFYSKVSCGRPSGRSTSGDVCAELVTARLMILAAAQANPKFTTVNNVISTKLVGHLQLGPVPNLDTGLMSGHVGS